MLNRDYKDMLECLLEERVSFLLVGAYALAVHGYPRATKDINFFVWANARNAASLINALRKFGAPLDSVSEADFSEKGTVFQIGNSPRRIDILTSISGIEFEKAYSNKKIVYLEGLKVPVISLQDLIANKRASGRPQDIVDVDRLTSGDTTSR